MDAGLKRALEEKVTGGARLDRTDGLALFACDDLAWLGGLAHRVRTERHGEVATFALTASVDLGSVPAASPGSADAAVGAARAAVADPDVTDITELHLDGVSGLDLGTFTAVLNGLGEALPKVSASGGSAADVQRLTERGASVRSTALALAGAGLRSLAPATAPGPDAEDAVREAHRAQLATPCLLPYGHAGGPGDFVDRVLRLRELQDGTGPQEGPTDNENGGFGVAVPAADGGGQLTGTELLKAFAVTRLLLDNVPHLSASRGALGPRATLLALQHGADDVTAPGEPGDRDHARLTELVELIQDAGCEPVLRSVRFAPLGGFDGPDPARRDVPQPMRI